MEDTIRHKYEEFKTTCLECRLCHDAGLCYPNSFPLFMQRAPVNTDILFILEAPNWNDTFTPTKRYLTVDPDTDPSGEFFWDLFTRELCLDLEKYLFLTNSVLCLPRLSNDKFTVTSRHINYCSTWLKKIIDVFQPRIVCTIGKKALRATEKIEEHFLYKKKLAEIVAAPFQWYGRTLYPLFHTALLGRKPPTGRSDELQRADWRKLRQLYDALTLHNEPFHRIADKFGSR
jgi:uracil-DNA glycosylase